MLTTAQSIQKPFTSYHCLWLRGKWFIPVDDEGFCVGECAEGALGFVIKLHCADEPDNFYALKLPRLIGDTHRENAYISGLMEQERIAVRRVSGHQASFTNRGLLHAGMIGDNLLRGPISTDPAHPEARIWNQAIVVVCFIKGKRPRFHLVRKEDDDLLYFPPIEELERPINNVIAFDKLAQKYQWERTIFLELAYGNIEPNAFRIDEALDRDSTGRTWYTAVPSVTYDWAPQTLQEAISRRLRGDWGLRKDLELVEIVCSGLRALHTRGMLHADLRPANIIVAGDPTEPQSYFLSDYGSFAHSTPYALDRYPTTSLGTRFGPVVAGERTSAFYAPERSLGRERETSDTAVFFNEGSNPEQITILLGWRSDLIDEQGQAHKEKVQTYIRGAKYSLSSDEFADTILKVGDRVQIREYIFELVEDERRLDDKQVFTCRRRYWQLYHGRIAIEVPDDLSFDTFVWIPIPRTVELLKWSVSTDLYSLGALLLYSIFGRAHDIEREGTATEPFAAFDRNTVEEQFNEMLTYLNSIPFFNAIWPELDWLRFRMEEELKDNRHNAITLAEAKFIRHDQSVRGPDDPENLRKAAVELTKRLTQTAPGVYDLVSALDFNLANFIFLMHFALSCMHRQDHLSSAAREQSREKPQWMKILPFCKDRHEAPNEKSIATKEALDGLKYLREIINRLQLGDMIPKDSDDTIRSYDPRPDVSIRVERDRLEREKDKLADENKVLEQERDSEHALLEELIMLNRKLEGALNSISAIVTPNPSILERFQATQILEIREILNSSTGINSAAE